MFYKDAPFTKPQEKTCGLSALPWRPNSTAAGRSWRRRRHSSPERPWSCRLRTPRRRRRRRHVHLFCGFRMSLTWNQNLEKIFIHEREYSIYRQKVSKTRRGKRSRGRPSRRWQDDIAEKEGTTWIRKASDRLQWKTLMEGYILQWVNKAQVNGETGKQQTEDNGRHWWRATSCSGWTKPR